MTPVSQYTHSSLEIVISLTVRSANCENIMVTLYDNILVHCNPVIIPYCNRLTRLRFVIVT